MDNGTQKYSLLFLAAFTVLLISTFFCIASALAGILAATPEQHDTISFWASSKLLIHQENPYDRQAIQQIQASAGFPIQKYDAFMTRNPPPALFLMAPLGLLGPRMGIIAWSLFLVVCWIASIRALRAIVTNSYEPSYVLLAWCFAPALCCVEVGQTGLIVLLGLALFLRFHDRRPFWAGAALSLCVVKPHLLLPFGVVLLAWIGIRKHWRVLVGAAVAIVVESLIAMVFDHMVWRQYRAMMYTERFAEEFIPTIGESMRYVIDRKLLWLEFLPAIAAGVWALWYFWRNRREWNWQTHGSILAIVSLIAAPYAWFTDHVLALPAILFALLQAGGPRKGSITLLMLIFSIATAELLLSADLFFKPNMLLGFLWLGWYLYATSESKVTQLTAAAA